MKSSKFEENITEAAKKAWLAGQEEFIPLHQVYLDGFMDCAKSDDVKAHYKAEIKFWKDSFLKEKERADLLAMNCNNNIEFNRIVGEFTGMLQGIQAWDIPKELHDKLQLKIDELKQKYYEPYNK